LNQYFITVLDDDGFVFLKRGLFETHHEAVEAMVENPADVISVIEIAEEVQAKVWLSDSSEILVEELI